MSSLQIPFRTLCEVLSNFAFYNPDFDFTERANFLSEKIKQLKFLDKFTVKLQSAKNDKLGKKKTIVERVVSLKKDSNSTNIDTVNSFLTYIKNNELEVQDIIFDKIDRKGISIYDLSSGEYAFLRVLFVLSFATQPNSLIILDEPENSLHPEWQQNIIEYIIETIEKFGAFQATLLIATHSPLITSSFSVKNVMTYEYFYLDNGNSKSFKFKWISYKYYGWSANLILTEQFHLLYPRDKEFSKLVNDTLELYANQYHIKLNGLKALASNIDKLESLNIKLSEMDPLHDVLQTLLSKKEDISLLLEQKNNE